MEPKPNYDRLMTKTLEGLNGRQGILLHACCAPCSSAVIERLLPYFDIALFYYNPNISPKAEYDRRLSELERLVVQAFPGKPVDFLPAPYEGDKFFEAARGLENEPEGGARCERCFRLRLEKTALAARENGFGFFTTTLTLSPLKDANLLNRLGAEIAERYRVKFLPSDFKKRDGYLRSLKLSEEYGLYRQDYCGCVYSLRERRGSAREEDA